jgi:hypothetical protein
MQVSLNLTDPVWVSYMLDTVAIKTSGGSGSDSAQALNVVKSRKKQARKYSCAFYYILFL